MEGILTQIFLAANHSIGENWPVRRRHTFCTLCGTLCEPRGTACPIVPHHGNPFAGSKRSVPHHGGRCNPRPPTPRPLTWPAPCPCPWAWGGSRPTTCGPFCRAWPGTSPGILRPAFRIDPMRRRRTPPEFTDLYAGPVHFNIKEIP